MVFWGIVVFSKSYCPYCRRAKGALSSLDIEYKALELDNLGKCSRATSYIAHRISY